MYGLCLINSHFTSDGTGRDFIIMNDQERRGGKVGKPGPYRTACLNRECKPRKRPNGPRPPSSERIRQMNKGQWQCSGEWVTDAKSTLALSSDASPKLKRSASDTLKTVANYDASMQAWTDARLPDIKRSQRDHHGWVSCHARTISAGSESRILGPDLTEPSFIGKSMASTASASFDTSTIRRAHGYFEPGVLRRPGSYDKIPMGFTANVDRVPREDRFLRERAPHECEVMRSTVRETRFIQKDPGHIVDIRRSN